MNYGNILAEDISHTATPQSRPIPGRESEMIQNEAGGFVFHTSDEQYLFRFLVQGSDGTYYATEDEITLAAAKHVHQMALDDPSRLALLVDHANRVQHLHDGTVLPAKASGRKSPSLFALAAAKVFAQTEEQHRQVHLIILAKNVVSTFGQMMEFLAYIYQLKGSGQARLDGKIPGGNGFKRTLRRWLTSDDRSGSERWLAMQFAKYRQRHYRVGTRKRSTYEYLYGAPQKDTRPSLSLSVSNVLRIAKPRPLSPVQALLYKWGTGLQGNAESRDELVSLIAGARGLKDEIEGSDALDYVLAFEELQRTTDGVVAARLIRDYGLTWEMIPSHLYGSDAPPVHRREVWRALLGIDAKYRMPLTALLRNLPRISAYGLTGDADVRAFLRDIFAGGSTQETLIKARLHPLAILSALLVYKRGFTLGKKKSTYGGMETFKRLEWMPDNGVANSLENAYHLSFGAVEPIGKRVGYFLDTSGSMQGGEIAGIDGLTPELAEAVMTATLVRTEKDWIAMAFSDSHRPTQSGNSKNSYGLAPLAFSAAPSVEEVQAVMERNAYNGGTDCALPFLWATANKEWLDVFVIQTDNQTWAGRHSHPSQALAEYRAKVNKNARCVVIGYTTNQSSINDPSDTLSMEFVGFDASAPILLNRFGRGEF